MSLDTIFPDLSGWEATRDTLHWYSKAVGVIPRTHLLQHPKWWHISLDVVDDGLLTKPMLTPDARSLQLKVDLRQHHVALLVEGTVEQLFDMQRGLTATAFGDELIAAVADYGLVGEYAREKFENEDGREYEGVSAEKYLHALTNANRIFNDHRTTIGGNVGPVQLWPHHFDLAFEWFGTRVERYEEHGAVQEYPSQINLGFSAGDSGHPTPYFYSNPWPFETEKLIEHPLPAGAKWHTTGWQGSLLSYAELANDPRAETRLRAYAQSIYQIASPTLLL